MLAIHCTTDTTRFTLEWQQPVNTGQALAGPVAGMLNDNLLLGGGANFPDALPWEGGKKKYHNSLRIFRFIQPDSLQLEQSYLLPHPTAYGVSWSTDAGILYAGGESEDSLTRQTWWLTYKNGKLQFDTLSDLPQPITNAAGCSIGKICYLAGGETPTGMHNRILAMDLGSAEKTWRTVAELPEPLSHAVLLPQQVNGQNYLVFIGGRRKTDSGISTFSKSVYRLSLATMEWSRFPDLATGLSAGTGLVLPDQSLVLLSGDDGTTFHQVERKLTEIKSMPDKEELVQQKNALLSAHPGFGKTVWRLKANAKQWELLDALPFTAPVTTTAIQQGNRIWIPCGEIKAGIRSSYLQHAVIHEQ